MKSDGPLLDSSSRTTEEYGGGSELPVTGYLIAGFLSFWIYTVRSYHAEIARHFAARLAGFRETCKEQGRPLAEAGLTADLIRRGFTVHPRIRTVCTALYGTSMALVAAAVAGQFVLAADQEPVFYLTYATLGGAAAAFSAATLAFLHWVCRTLRDHEYCELLIAKHAFDGTPVREISPSAAFVRRWNHNAGAISLFAMSSLALFASPVFATWRMHRLWRAGADEAAIQAGVLLWAPVILVCAGVFHYWGTRLLMTMFNGHLRIESANRDPKWAAGPGASVVADGSGAAPTRASDIFPRRALAAIMMTDMVGYSRLMEADEDAAYARLQEHNAIVRSHLGTNGGHEVKTIGDAFLVRFTSATQALQSAMGIQKQFRLRNSSLEPDAQIWVRIGIHIGDVLTMDDDIFGNGVNLVSRIEPLAEPGGICITADVHNLVCKAIEIKAVSIGRQKLKNIKDVPELFRVILD